MLFSIIVPVYNVEAYLDECIQSILVQVEEIEYNCEIILIDDGSTDNSGKICDSYQQKYTKLIKVFHNTNRGLLLTRRFGFQRAQGEYIINCDSDDKLEKGMLSTVKNTIEKYQKPDVVLFNFNYYINGKKEAAYKNIFSNDIDVTIRKEEVLTEFLKGHSVVSLCSKTFKRKCIDEDIDYGMLSYIGNGEDTLQSIEIYGRAESYVYLNKSLYNYRIGSGMTRKFDLNYYKGFKAVLEVIRNQKSNWNVNDFDRLFSIKVLQTTGRAITQSRYNIWESKKEHIKYLRDIREDDMLKEAVPYIMRDCSNLQKSHLLFLVLLKYRMYYLICILLSIKNNVE